MKEFTFITTVKIAKNVAQLYPNYYINDFKPKSLAKRFTSGNSPKDSLKILDLNIKQRSLKMLAWDYYIIKESKNKFRGWTQAGLEHLRKQYKNLQDEKERKRIKKILDDLNK